MPTNVIQSNEYYPFGLQTDNSWTREGSSNNFLYNGGTELNQASGNYDLFFRGYDPELGRFMQVDPLASMFGSLSPYNYASNNPALFNDPLGLNPVRRVGDDFVIDWDKVGESGGTWTNTGGSGTWTGFSNDSEAANWGMENYGELGATEDWAYAKLYGISTNSSWVHYKYDYKVSTRNGSNTKFKYVGPGDGKVQMQQQAQQGEPKPINLEGLTSDILRGLVDWASYLDQGVFARSTPNDEPYNIQRDILTNVLISTSSSGRDTYTSRRYTAGNVSFDYTIPGSAHINDASQVRRYDIRYLARASYVLDGNKSHLKVWLGEETIANRIPFSHLPSTAPRL